MGVKALTPTTVVTSHPEGDMNACTMFHGNSSSSSDMDKTGGPTDTVAQIAWLKNSIVYKLYTLGMYVLDHSYCIIFPNYSSLILSHNILEYITSIKKK